MAPTMEPTSVTPVRKSITVKASVDHAFSRLYGWIRHVVAALPPHSKSPMTRALLKGGPAALLQ